MYAAYDGGNGYLYVVNSASDNVSVIHGTKVVGSVPVGGNPYAPTYDPKDGYVYVTNRNTSNVSILDGTSLIGTVTVGSNPMGSVYDPADGDVYVENSGLNSMIVSVLAGTTLATSINVSYYNPTFATYDPVDGNVYVDFSGGSAQVVTVINGTSIRGNASVAGTPPLAPVCDPVSGDVYVPVAGSEGEGTDHVTIVQGPSLVGTVRVGSQPTAAVYDPSDGYVYVTNGGSSNLTVINGITSVGSVPVGSSPTTPAYDSSNGYLYVPNDASGNVSVINGTHVVGSIPVGAGPQSATYDPASGVVYVMNMASRNVSAISTWYPVTFTESGLLSGTTWSVTLNGSLVDSSTSTIVFTEPDGTYPFSVGSVSGYNLSQTSGSISVKDAAVSQPVTFVGEGHLTATVTPADAAVTLDGQLESGTAGSYSWAVESGPHYVNATLAGYSPYSNLVTVLPGGTVALSIVLTPVTTYGYLNGTVTPATATLIANGVIVPVEAGAFNVSLTPGAYYLSVTATGYQSLVAQTNISAGKATDLAIALKAAPSTVTLSGSVTPANASVALNGFVAYVNATGAFAVSVVPGAYSVSVTAPGYFALGENLTISSNTSLAFVLTKEPASTSTRTSGNLTATGYNVSVANLSRGNGSISVAFTATPGGTLVVSLPYRSIANVTLADLLSSRVYINGVRYTDFSVTVTTNFTVSLTVHGLGGDPTLFWALSPSTPAPPSSTSKSTFLGLPGDLGYCVIAVAVIVVIGLAIGILRLRRRRPPAPTTVPAPAGASASPAAGATPGATGAEKVTAGNGPG